MSNKRFLRGLTDQAQKGGDKNRPMPITTTVSTGMPVAPSQWPLRTPSENRLTFCRTAWIWGMIDLPSRAKGAWPTTPSTAEPAQLRQNERIGGEAGVGVRV